MIQLQPPIRNFDWVENISQLFGVNAQKYQEVYGIPNHNGLDIFAGNEKFGYGTEILAAHDGIVESVVYDNPHHTKGSGVYLRSMDGTFFTCYWHLSGFAEGIYAKKEIKTGDVLGLMGNSGTTFSTLPASNPYRGTHLHFGLGFDAVNNEYNHYVDPTPFLWKLSDKLPLYFPSDLYSGCSGDYVAWLQTCLTIDLGLDTSRYGLYGHFGPKTKEDIGKFQEKYNIDTGFLGFYRGRFGPMSRFMLSKLYSSYPLGVFKNSSIRV